VTARLLPALLALAFACGRFGYGPGAEMEGDPADGGANDGAGDGANVVFVTSATHVPGQLGGLEAADEICAIAAAAAGLAGEYVAWLSTAGVNARDRLAGARGWVRPDGRPFADTVDDIVAGRIFHPPSIDERGGLQTSRFVTTGTGENGEATPDRCADYTSTATVGTFGSSSATTTRFTRRASDGCDHESARLYCFGVDRSLALEVPPEEGRLAFVTGSPWMPGGGLGAADQHCAGEAADAGLTGSFRALLATSTQSAAARFDLAGPQWVRIDGVALAASAEALMAAEIEAPLNVTASGSYLSNSVWTGGGDSSAPADVGADTCEDWTQATNSVRGGRGAAAETAAHLYFGATDNPCGSLNRLYCLQE
jgi:hypothetical protein